MSRWHIPNLCANYIYGGVWLLTVSCCHPEIPLNPKVWQVGLLDAWIDLLALFHFYIEHIRINTQFHLNLTWKWFHFASWTSTILQLLYTFFDEVQSDLCDSQVLVDSHIPHTIKSEGINSYAIEGLLVAEVVILLLWFDWISGFSHQVPESEECSILLGRININCVSSLPCWCNDRLSNCVSSVLRDLLSIKIIDHLF